jgi:hypothetical protein
LEREFENIVTIIVREATNWQLIKFSWWFLTGNKKADIVVYFVSHGFSFQDIYHLVNNKTMKPSFLYFLKQFAIVVAFVFLFGAIVWLVAGLVFTKITFLLGLVLSVMIVALWNILKST